MIRTRFSTLGALLAAVALASTANAQSYAFGRTEMGQIVPARFATTTQQLFATTNVAVSLPLVAQTASSGGEKIDLVAESMPADNWGSVPLHASDADADADADEAKSSEPGFFGSTMGRVSIVGIAGLAGASYFAFRGSDARTSEAAFAAPILPATGPTTPGTGAVAFAENPEPASMALMVLGLGALGIVARRRRAN
jgi:hypothetical protein